MEKAKFIYGDRKLYNDYAITSLIGKGNNSVYEIVNKQNREDIQCVKEIRLGDRNAQSIFEKEVKLLEYLKKHPHETIIEYKGSFVIAQELNEFNCCKKGFIQMEKGITSLDHVIQNRIQTGQRFTQTEIIHFLMSMIEAHKHLQSLQIAHRDIKPQNILLMAMEPLKYKVCDVGVGTAVGSDSTRTRTLMGTVSYLSPQLLRAYRQNKYSINYNPYKSDVYSLGLVTLYFCSLVKLLAKQRNEDQQTKVRALIKQVKRSYRGIYGLSKTLKQMLIMKQTQRPDFEELYQKIEENGWLKLKYDGFRSTNLHKYMANSAPVQGQTTISSPQEAPVLQMYSQNPNVLHSLKVQLPSLNMNPSQQKQLIEDLRRIKYLDLNKLSINLELNFLEGEFFKTLVDGIQKNVHLEQLNLMFWNNYLKEVGFGYVMDLFKKLTHLKKLYLSLSANGIADFSQFELKFSSIENLQQLEQLVLDLGLNRLTSQVLPSILSSLSKLSKLTTLKLNLESNRITPLALKLLPNYFCKLTNIRQLQINLSGNNVGNEGMYGLGDIATLLPKLQIFQLVLWTSQITDKGLSEFMKSVQNNCVNITQLRLILWNNHITQKGIQTLAAKLSNFRSLQRITINFANNKIGDGGVRALNKAIIQLPQLKQIKMGLDSVGLTQVGCRYIGRMLTVHKHIHKLQISLRANIIGVKGVQYLLAGLNECKRISQLSLILQSCKIKDEGAVFMTKIFPKLKHLTSIYLNLSDCQLFDDSMFSLSRCLEVNIEGLKEVSIDLRKNILSKPMRTRLEFEFSSNSRVDLKLPDAY